MSEPRQTSAGIGRPPGGERAVAAVLPVAAPQVEIAPPLPPLTRGEMIGIAVAAVLHVVVLGWMLVERVNRIGGGGALQEIISVEIVEAVPGARLTIGDAAETDRGRRDPEDGALDRTPDTLAAREASAPDARSAEPPPPALPELEDANAEAPRALIVPRSGQGTAREGEAVTEGAPDAAKSDASMNSAPAEVGGSLRGTHPVDVPGVSVAMASGAAQDYAKQVLEALARSRPKVDPGNAGRVHFSFAVAPGGHAIAVRITKSSGNRRIDEAALSTVRDLRFPPPPAGLRGSDLIYETYFDFRPGKGS